MLFQFLNQTAALANTTLVTPTQDQTLHISCYAEKTAGGPLGGQLFHYTDDNGAQTNQSGGGTAIIRVTANNAIGISSDLGSATSYNLYIRID